MAYALHQLSGGRFNHIYLVRQGENAALIDTGNPGQADAIVRQLVEHDVTPDNVRLILITHGHTDHFGSAAALQARLDAPVAVHTADAVALRRGIHQPDSLTPSHWLTRLLMRLPFDATAESVPTLEPDLIFEDGWRLDDYGIDADVIPTPGHTPGAISVLLDKGEAIVGDLVAADPGTLFLRPGPPYVAWNLDQNWRSLRALMDRRPHTVYTTHGGPFGADAILHLLTEKER
jgi:glyoxylase-like metal-dependent hydrolase (beta-lactamase superfamily II)